LTDLFDCQIPDMPSNKTLSDKEKKRFEELYPAGEHEATRRLEKFLKEKCSDYDKNRSMLPGENTSALSPYFASGAISARTAVVTAKRANKNHLDRYDQGHMTWISEVAWRDFYRHVLVHWPFIWYGDPPFLPLLRPRSCVSWRK
jgi:deoxyribodipyrimidine photo-lyase